MCYFASIVLFNECFNNNIIINIFKPKHLIFWLYYFNYIKLLHFHEESYKISLTEFKLKLVEFILNRIHIYKIDTFEKL